MFRVFTAVLIVAIVWFVSVNCAIDDTIAELTVQLAHLAQKCSANDVYEMKLRHLTDRGVTCNDGSPAGYYLRKAHGSKRWIVFLEGGWFCGSATTCRERHKKMRGLMSSKQWRTTKRGIGLLSTDPKENPSWWNSNHVFIPYCSSDAWSGNASIETGRRFSFLGTRILDRVIEELLSEGLSIARHLLLAGSSAGGIGVILNLDRIAKNLKMAGFNVHVRGLTDSGWYLIGDESPLSPRCLVGGGNNWAPSQAIKEGMAYWNGVVPEDCARRNPTEKWKCYFGEHVYRTDSNSPKHSPLFVFQWLYDTAQLAWTLTGQFSIPRKLKKDEYQKVLQCLLGLGTKLKQSFNRTKGLECAVFAPSCASHTILTRNDWLNVRVGGKTLNDALDAWYQSSDQSLASCPTLIESECNYPQCSKGCPQSDISTVPQGTSDLSPGVPIP